MIKKFIGIKFFLIAFLFVVFFWFVADKAFALEVPLPGLTCPSTGSCLPQYVVYFFNWLIGITGLLALISFTVGAVGLMNPNIEAHNDAKDRIKSAILGLLLTLTAYLILFTINPAIVNNINLQALSPLEGVFLTNGLDDKPCPQSLSDTSDLNGYTTIKYTCSNNDGPTLLVWMFINSELERNNDLYNDVEVIELNCGETQDISSYGSFKMAFKTHGVYYYLGDDCSKYMSGPNTISGNVSDPFKQEIWSIKIVNDSLSSTYYSVIFHKENDLKKAGICTFPPISISDADQCVNLPDPTVANTVDILKINMDPGSSGNGVSFYSTPFGWDAGANAGFWKISGQDIVDIINQGIGLRIQPYSYTNVDRPASYKTPCASFQTCQGSIKISGNYLVVLFRSFLPSMLSGYCQTFTKDVPNLNVQPILNSGGNFISDVWIIPTK